MSKLKFKRAEEKDLDSIVTILRDDFLGKNREADVGSECYASAFEEILEDKNQHLMVVLADDVIVGTCHLTIMPSLTFSGKRRLNVEAVRLSSKNRGQKIGEWMFEQIRLFAKQHQCHMAQLACIRLREDAMRFYEKIGFEPTHVGYKMILDK